MRFLFLIYFLFLSSDASAAVRKVVRPNETITCTWVRCSHTDINDNVMFGRNGNSIGAQANKDDENEIATWGFETFPNVASASTVIFRFRCGGSENYTISTNLPGTSSTTLDCTNPTFKFVSQGFSGAFTQGDLDALTLSLTTPNLGDGDNMEIDYLYADVVYVPTVPNSTTGKGFLYLMV